MPVAVPTGHYDVAARVDLSPFFGIITYHGTLELVTPGPEVLDERLKQLASADAEVRQTALFDLFHFPEAGDRIFPALLGLLNDETQEEDFRGMVLSVMGAFPKQLVAHVDRFIAMASDEKAGIEIRSAAAWLLAQHAPAKDEKVEKCLAALAETQDPKQKQFFDWTIQMYRNRAEAGAGGFGIAPATPAEPEEKPEEQKEDGD